MISFVNVTKSAGNSKIVHIYYGKSRFSCIKVCLLTLDNNVFIHGDYLHRLLVSLTVSHIKINEYETKCVRVNLKQTKCIHFCFVSYL